MVVGTPGDDGTGEIGDARDFREERVESRPETAAVTRRESDLGDVSHARNDPADVAGGNRTVDEMFQCHVWLVSIDDLR